MKRLGFLCLSALLAVILSVLAAGTSGRKEPVYQGKALSQWILEAHDIGIFEQSDETKAAMQALSPEAVPYLLKEFTRPVVPWRERLGSWLNRAPVLRLHFITGEERVRLAGQGLMLLETNAASVVPTLLRYREDPLRGPWVTDILRGFGGVVPEEVAGTNEIKR